MASYTTFLTQNLMGNPKKESKIQNKAYFGRYDGFSKVWCKIRESDLCVLTNFQNKMKLIPSYFQSH